MTVFLWWQRPLVPPSYVKNLQCLSDEQEAQHAASFVAGCGGETSLPIYSIPFCNVHFEPGAGLGPSLQGGPLVLQLGSLLIILPLQQLPAPPGSLPQPWPPQRPHDLTQHAPSPTMPRLQFGSGVSALTLNMFVTQSKVAIK